MATGTDVKTCDECGGSAKCKWCSPKGSGTNKDGTTCQVCQRTGKCQYKNRDGYQCIAGKIRYATK